MSGTPKSRSSRASNGCSSPGLRWSNFAGNLETTPALYFLPHSVAELQEFIRLNRHAKVRAVGSGHSWSPLAVTDFIMVDLRDITRNGKKAWRFQENGVNFVTVLPSATIADVEAACEEPQPSLPPFTFPTTSVSRNINMIGFVATGSHGTGWEQPTVADLIWRMEIIGADGTLRMLSQEATPLEMNAARVSLGMLGLIASVTFRIEEMFHLLDEELTLKCGEVLGPNPEKRPGPADGSCLQELVCSNDYVELFWVPGSGLDTADGFRKMNDGGIRIKQWNRTRDPIRDLPEKNPDWESVLAIAVMEEAARHTPRDSPLHASIASTQWGFWQGIQASVAKVRRSNGYVARASDALHYQDYEVPIIDFSVAIPIVEKGNSGFDFTSVARAAYRVINCVQEGYAQGLQSLTGFMQMRFLRNSQSWLSPAYAPAGSNTHFCFIEIASAYPRSVVSQPEREAMIEDFKALVNILSKLWIDELQGKPHWAKYWQDITGLEIAALYPRENRRNFNMLREQMDPQQMFMNSFLSKHNLFCY